MCLDPLVTFGVKQVPESEKMAMGSIGKILKILQILLIERKAPPCSKDLIINLMNLSKEDQWNNWYRRIN